MTSRGSVERFIRNAGPNYFVLWPTNAQLFHKLSHSYMFSTLSCHAQGACNQYLAKLHKYFKCSCCYYNLQLRCFTLVLCKFSYYSRWYLSIIKYLESIIRNRSQWPRGLRRRSLAARLLRLRARIPPGAWIFVCCECCVLSGRGLCDGLIIRSEESYRMWRVVVCDQETS